MPRIKNYIPLFVIIPCLIIFYLFGPFNFNKTVSGSPGGTEGARTEAEFSSDADLYAIPDEDIVAVFLESPGSTVDDSDTGGLGFDVIPYRYTDALEWVFCWKDDNEGAEHYMTLSDSEGNEILTVTANGECVTELIEPGDHTMRLYHDGNSDKSIAVFIVPEGDKSILNTTTDEAADNVATFLDTNKCIGCNLSGVNLNNADLSGVDLSEAILNEAILVDANLSGANLSGAELKNADLSRANLKGADLSGSNLSGAILINADLTDADLTLANLENADMTDAVMSNTKLTQTGQLKAASADVSINSELTAVSQEVDAVPTDTCAGGTLSAGDGTKNLLLSAPCEVKTGVYRYQNVNIIKDGVLEFKDEGGETHFWAKSMLVENKGSLIAGENSDMKAFGAMGGTLIIHLYGQDSDKVGIGCLSPKQNSSSPECGIDLMANVINKMDKLNPSSCMQSNLPGGVMDECFYEYADPDDVLGETGLFGRKVLAVSYGGTINLFGKKGATYSATELDSSDSGKSWARLEGTIKKKETKLKVDRDVDWEVGDHIVVTTTDYLPGHSEKVEITKRKSAQEFEFKVLDPYTNAEIPGGLQHEHYGMKYTLNLKKEDKNRLNLKIDAAETRAAVALLTRSIRIVSGGNMLPTTDAALKCKYDCFPTTDTKFHYGGHMMIRQGIQEAKIQGVEFYQMGQGGRKGRYPVHMHLIRKAPEGTFIKDSSVHDSMTRWYTLHGTQGVMLARNVGYMSIGHGYYIEDGTETDNKFYSNIGIFARAAIDNIQNPRMVPGILAYTADKIVTNIVPTHSDYTQPTIFWIMNGWNDFEYNMAAGANACGVCYWWLPSQISGPSQRMYWGKSYAGQQVPTRAGITPLKNFKGNYCSTAMTAFNSIQDISICNGVGGPSAPLLEPITTGNISPKPPNQGGMNELYYPILDGSHKPTRCLEGKDCSKEPPICAAGSARKDCMVPVIHSFTSAFTWPETNFAAIWLRPQWYLVINSVISDVQNAGLSFVTGGDYTESNFLPGQWQLARQNVFIGQTQPDNPFASHAGPVNKDTFHDLKCENLNGNVIVSNYCLLRDEGLSIQLSGFANNQRLFSIYDGPSFEDSNAFFNIKKAEIDDCKPSNNGNCKPSKSMYGRVIGMPKDRKEDGTVEEKCILPNAAIAWKQSNGFYYPPAFHSSNLFFEEGKVEIRHYVIEPLFAKNDTYAFYTDDEEVKKLYCTYNPSNPLPPAGDGQGGLFSNFSAIDRQTILNDDDGTLTGLVNTISVNEDPFFNAPTETTECESEITAKTSPYDYVTTAVYPGCVAKKNCGGKCSKDGTPCASTGDCPAPPNGPPGNLCLNTDWTDNCGSNFCYGVPLYRQLLTKNEASNTKGQEIRMMGMGFFQRSNLTANNGVYYIDTTVSKDLQKKGLLLVKGQEPSLNVFTKDETYYVFFIFAKENTKQTYQLFVGKGRDENMLDNIVKGIRTGLKQSKPLDVKPITIWPEKWDRKYDPGTGILEVTVDFSGFTAEFEKAIVDRCKPESFCAWNESTKRCGCSADLNSDLSSLCNEELGIKKRTVCDWAVRAIDCPEGGCYGFSFTMVEDPPAEPLSPPAPCCFPKENWDVKFDTASKELAGSCLDDNPPGPEFCTSPKCMVPGDPGGGTPPPGGSTPDADDDGIPNSVDVDSDNDGIPNDMETATNGIDPQVSSRVIIPADPDNDGIPNELDLDSDGDCIPDHFEAGGNNDANRDGLVDNFIDADADGHHDAHDTSQGGSALPLPDTDGDEVPNFLDNDSDNDGMTDTDETGGSGDANDDGVLDNPADANGDGLADIVPATGNVCLILDTDGDGLPDHLDVVSQPPDDPPGDGDGDGGTNNGSTSCALSANSAVKSGLDGLLVYLLIPAGVLIRRKFISRK